MPLALPPTFDLRFEGFSPETFAVLDRMRQHPHVDQYRKERDELRTHVTQPFRRFRDDLVVNVVLPNRLNLETERNVFSRLLKNDFGAGGANSHQWMSFYRPDRTRLSDLQPFHGIDPDGFASGLHVAGRDRSLLAGAKQVFTERPDEMLDLLNPLLERGGWQFAASVSGSRRAATAATEPIESLPDGLRRARGISIYRSFTRERVLEWKGELVVHAAEAMRDVWPFYEAFTA